MYRNGWMATAVLLLTLIPSLSMGTLLVEHEPLTLKNHLHWIKTQQALTIEDVEAFTLSQFNSPLGRDFSDGYRSSHYWFRFTLDFENAKREPWLLEIPFPLLDKVILYQPLQDGKYEASSTGDRLVFSNRPIPVHRFVFPLKPQNGIATYYLHVLTQDSVQVPVEVWPESQYLAHYSLDLGIQMAFFGAMLVMIIYNIFIYFSTRDRNYLFYVAFISLMVFFQLGLQGFSHQWLWPNFPWWSNVSIPLFGVASLLCGLLFVRNLLQTKEGLPKFDRVLSIISYSMIFTVPLILWGDYDTAIDASLVVTSVFFNMTLIAIILMVLKQDRTAKIVLVAWSIFLTSGTVSMLGIFGILPLEIAGTHALQIGSMLEVVLLSLALADRIKTLRREKLDMEIMSSDILRVSNEQLERSNRMKDAFIATISHEVKTPMNAILGASQLLRDDKEDNKIEYLNIIDQSGSTLLSIIDNVLDYSRLQADRLSVNESEVCLPQLLKEVTQLFEVQAGAGQVRIWLTYGDTYPKSLVTDEILLKQALMNLISNALKFTESGFVWVHVECHKEDQLIIEVEDSGIGISEEQQQRLFTPFSQADDSTARQYGGTGLGLVITKKICELLGGSIRLVSTAGVGSCFKITLPLISATLDQTNRLPIAHFRLFSEREDTLFSSRVVDKGEFISDAEVEANGGALEIKRGAKNSRVKGILTEDLINSHINKEDVDNQPNLRFEAKGSSHIRILAVDDDPTNRLIIDKILARLDVDYMVESSGEAAMEQVKQQPFDLIFMDIEMPGMDGYDTTRQIRDWERISGLNNHRIIALSAHVANEFKEKAMGSGMNGFMHKPIQLTKIKEEIEKLSSMLNTDEH